LPRRVVDDDVEAAEALHGLLDQRLAKGFVLEVAGDRKAVAAFLLDQSDHFLRIRFLRRQIVDGNIGAFARVRDRGGAAHAGISTCNQRLAAGQATGALVAGLTMVRPRIHLAGKARPGLRLLLERRLWVAGDGIDQVLLRHGCISFRCWGSQRSRCEHCARGLAYVPAGYIAAFLIRHEGLRELSF
jgi:hypothetical protein